MTRRPAIIHWPTGRRTRCGLPIALANIYARWSGDVTCKRCRALAPYPLPKEI